MLERPLKSWPLLFFIWTSRVKKIYLNNAASSYPKPEKVMEAVYKSLLHPPENPYRDNVTARSWNTRCHELIGQFYHVSEQRIVLLSSATEAINAAIHGLIKINSQVITTEVEHNAVLRPLYKLQRDKSIDLVVVPCQAPGTVATDDIAKVINSQTGLIVISHVSNVTGVQQNIEEIASIAWQKNIPVLIDAAQSAGIIQVDLSKYPGVIVAYTGHKSFLGPSGTGGLAIGEKVRLQPWKYGGTGIHSEDHDMPDIWPLRFEAGTPNHCGIAGLAAAVEYIFEEGLENLNNRRRELANYLIQNLKSIKGLTMYNESEQENIAGIVSFNLRGWDPEDLGYLLDESFGIRLRTGLHCAPLIHKCLGTFPLGTVRISISHFTSMAELEYLIQSLKKIVKK